MASTHTKGLTETQTREAWQRRRECEQGNATASKYAPAVAAESGDCALNIDNGVTAATYTAAVGVDRSTSGGGEGPARNENGSAGRIRTAGLLVMSQASYLCSTAHQENG